jgi:hypothetical protein
MSRRTCEGTKVRRYEGRVVLLFDGYDADPRSLVEILECVDFFRAVDRQWSYWLHFLVARPDALNLAFLLLAEVRPLSLDSEHRTFAVNDPDQLANLLARLFASMNTSHTNHGVRLIYAAIGGLTNATKPADVITVFEQLQSLGKAEDCGGLVYLNALAQSVPSAANLRRYAEIVRERAVLRTSEAHARKDTRGGEPSTDRDRFAIPVAGAEVAVGAAPRALAWVRQVFRLADLKGSNCRAPSPRSQMRC